MTADQYPLGNTYIGGGNIRNPGGGGTSASSSSGQTTGGLNIDPHNEGGDGDGGGYKTTRFTRIWLTYYMANKWWTRQQLWLKTSICLVPVIISLLIILILAIQLGKVRKPTAPYLADNVCQSSECIRTAGRIVSHMNLSADPCANFYEYACGGYAQIEEIPIGKKVITQFTKREAMILKHLKQSIEKPAVANDPVVQKVRAYYQACLNTLTTEIQGVQRLRTMVQDLGGFAFDDSFNANKDWSFEEAVAKRSRYTMTGIFQVGVSPDYFDTSRNIMFLDRGRLGLGLNTRDFYVNKSIGEDPVLNAYVTMLSTYVQLITGKSVSRQLIADVVSLEQKIAACHSTQADRRNVGYLYREVTLAELFKNASYIKWDRFLTNLLKGIHLDVDVTMDESVIVLDTPYFKNLSTIIEAYTDTTGGIRTLQNYIVLLAITTYAPRMGSDFRNAYTRFLTVYNGARGQAEPWLDCLGDTNQKLGFALGKMYLDRYSPRGQKERASALIADVKHAYHDLISDSVWMDPTTKRNALTKLDAMTYDVAFPDWLRNSTFVDLNYINFTITDDHTANVFAYYNHSIRTALRRFRQKPDPTRWALTPQTVNGLYEVTQNKVFVAAALLHEPFFYHNEGVPDALSYGSLGVMSGHEIAHGFDDRGQAFDEKGNVDNWWTSKTYATYRNHTQCFVKQFSAYTIDSGRIDGRQTLGENLADASGLRAAFNAYKKAQSEGRIAGVEARLAGLDLNSDQLFFLSFAQTYCTLLTKEALRNQVYLSPHSPSAVRVVGTLANSPEFSLVYGCKGVSTMNRREKCYIW